MKRLPVRGSPWAFALGLTLAGLLACGGSDGGTTTDGGASRPAQGDGLPCDVARVLHDVCRQCHTEPPQRGAPFPLENHDDVTADRGGVVGPRMLAEIKAGRMPAAPVTLPQGDRDILVRWLEGGFPRSDATCQ